MSTNDSAALQTATTTTEKRAQWEAFDFQVLDVGAVRVTNNSHAAPAEHTYRVDVDLSTGATTACECPTDEFHPGPCKHRVAVEDTPAVLAAAAGVGDAGDADEGDESADAPERRDEGDREKVLVRLTPRALHELYIETKDLSPDARQAGHTAECDLCGESVPLEKAVPNPRGEPVHRRCYIDAYGGPEWLEHY